MNIPSLNALAQMLAGQLGNCLAGGTVILLFAGLFSNLLRRGNSGARFAVWLGGLVALGSVPVLAVTWSLAVMPGVPYAHGGRAAITLPGAWALYLFVVWAVIASVAMARIAIGFRQVWVLRSRSATLDPRNLVPELQETLAQFQPMRTVAILLSDEIQSPTAIGLLSPAVVLPKWLLSELSTAELRQIFLHELAHLRRWDDWSNLLQKIVKALFFFHPAVWWMERQISLEREMACDEAVLAHTGNPRAYAQCLVRLAEKSFFRRSAMLAQAAVSRVGQTSQRVVRILGAERSSDTGIRKLIAPSLAAALIACVALLARAPRLIAFESGGNATVLAQTHLAAPKLSGMVEAPVASAAVVNVSEKWLAWISSAVPRPKVAAAIRPRLEMPVRQDYLAREVVDARFGFEGNDPDVIPNVIPSVIPNVTMVNDAQASEVIVVFVESRWDGSSATPVWQIRMWHLTMLRTSNGPVAQATPQKVI